jgi:hypothetical protein
MPIRAPKITLKAADSFGEIEVDPRVAPRVAGCGETQNAEILSGVKKISLFVFSSLNRREISSLRSE